MSKVKTVQQVYDTIVENFTCPVCGSPTPRNIYTDDDGECCGCDRCVKEHEVEDYMWVMAYEQVKTYYNQLEDIAYQEYKEGIQNGNS